MRGAYFLYRKRTVQFLKQMARRMLRVSSRLGGGRAIFEDKLFWAKYRFRSERATYYHDLAQRIEHMPGEPLSNHFAKDAARRAGEPIGMLAAHWLARWEGADGEIQRSRLTDIFRGTVPNEDLPILAVAEEGGDIKEGLLSLAKNLKALEGTKVKIFLTMASLIATLVILHVYIAVMALIVAPQIDNAFSHVLSVKDYGPIASAYHNGSVFVRHWGWLVVAVELAAAAWIAVALPGYVGRWRGWLDRKTLIFDFFRRFQAAQFFAGMASVTKRFGGDAKNLANGLALMRVNAYPYLAYHIERIELNLEYNPNLGGKVFDTGLLDRETAYRIEDIAEYEGDLSAMLSKVSEHMLESAPAEMLERATKFNRHMTILLIIVITGLAYLPAFMAQELKARAQFAAMARQAGAATPAGH